MMQAAVDLATAVQHKEWIGLSYGNLAYVYFKLGNYAMAKKFADIDKSISLTIDSYESAAGTYNLLASIALEHNDYTLAKRYVDSSFALLSKWPEERTYSTSRLDAYRIKSEYYKRVANIDSAYKYLKALSDLRDTIAKIQDKNIFITKASALELSRKSQNTKLLAAAQRNEQYQRNFIVIIFIAIVFLLLLGFYIVRQKNKINAVLLEKQLLTVQQKKAVEQRELILAKANAEKTKLFSIIAHDLRSPINNLKTLLMYIVEAPEFEKLLIENIGEISKRVAALSETMENLLSWSVTHLNGIKTEPKTLALHTIMAKQLNLLQGAIEDKSIQIVNHVQPTDTIFADENQIETVCRNLLSNAIKFSNVSGIIEIECSHNETDTVICIKDNGVGMYEDKRQSLFSDGMGYVASFGTNGEKGLGLGLVICKEFIQNHHGKIWVSANSPTGSVFCFSLPSSDKIK